MKLISRIALVVLALLSLAAGLAKLMQLPQEVGFFAEAGLDVFPLIALGGLQVAGGTLVWIPRLRQLGLLLMIAGFFVSVLVVLMTGNPLFAAVSMLPVIIGIGIVLYDRRTSTAP